MRTAMVSMIADIHTLAKTNSGQKNAALMLNMFGCFLSNRRPCW